MPADPVPDPLLPALLLQLVLILVNAVFAASEIAVISLNENRLRKQVDMGDKVAARLMRMVEKPSSFLSTIQVSITLAGFLGSAFAANNFADDIAGWMVGIVPISLSAAHTIALVLVTIILSYFSLVLGELAPKRIAMQHADKVARFAADLITGMSYFLRPMIALLSGSTNLVLRALGVDPNSSPEKVTEEEIRLMVDIGEEKGAIETNEREMIENVFEFNNMTAAEVMTHRTDMTAIWIADTPEVILRTITESGLSRFPVYDEDLDDIIGVLSTRTWLLNEREQNPRPLVELLRETYFVPETVKADVLFRNMQKRKTHIAIVVDEFGGTSGLVTMEDLLEEIVGNIYDEFDPQVMQDIVQLEPNKWRVSGGIDLETLSEALGVDLPEDEEYSTLGGLVYSCLSSIPEDGSQPDITTNGLNIHVEQVEDRRVIAAVLSKCQPNKEPRSQSAEPEEAK
ncbi:MAG: hemolysin family protein [Oscillospiraceae bacterium]|nr:hemolysin family protein [Oscillospiraceae bacterium]